MVWYTYDLSLQRSYHLSFLFVLSITYKNHLSNRSSLNLLIKLTFVHMYWCMLQFIIIYVSTCIDTCKQMLKTLNSIYPPVFVVIIQFDSVDANQWCMNVFIGFNEWPERYIFYIVQQKRRTVVISRTLLSSSSSSSEGEEEDEERAIPSFPLYSHLLFFSKHHQQLFCPFQILCEIRWEIHILKISQYMMKFKNPKFSTTTKE